MELMDALRDRRTVRDYRDLPVARSTLEGLIGAANWAPSAFNTQPWAFVVIEGAERLQGYSVRAKRTVLAALIEDSPLMKLKPALEDPKFNLFYGAPTLVAICATSSQDQAIQDCYLAAQNLMLAAYANGLGTCFVGLSRLWLNQPEVKAELGIPEIYVPVAPIIVGHPNTVKPSERRNPAVIWG